MFEETLATLLSEFEQMGARVNDMCLKAPQSFIEADQELALEVIKDDLGVDECFERIRAHCFDALLRFQPVASDLRLVMGIEHCVGHLERAGDHAKTISKRVVSGSAMAIKGDRVAEVEALTQAVSQSLHLAVQSVITRNSHDAKRVLEMDSNIDARHDAIFDGAMTQLRRTKNEAPGLVQLLFVSKSLERIGDHATNIAEEAIFLTRGSPPGATRIQSSFNGS